ncbi:Osmotically-inducible protein OsmY, contains BON domain [Clostridium acidisoli DSM 12555]|uniref:Osmotically-inducible protein OsmY, contains BON domain n=1 Tax=Clostridium acidisoli DSM 12555 TaxID=1121291 RepID=A0A1W1XZE0_9CLOT|nr:BON domain-containing protein [Clostridium acidisoli]SMC29245.1 Osmotically-inducible protein OsmY, contains BON domain [Clostridium acidisoli DSM 12555]
MNEPVNDQRIVTSIKSELIRSMKYTSQDIKIKSVNGIVSLDGFTNVLAEKENAERIAYKVEGVTEVKNNIIISLDGGESDKELTRLLNDNLRNSTFKERLLGVSGKVSGGSALLVGKVLTERDRQLAINEANKTFGIRDVVSTIKLTAFKDDTSLTNDINMALMQSKINVNDISAIVIRGKVNLTGYAEKKEDFDALVTLLQSIPGVEEVNNNLKLYTVGTGIS